MASRRPGRDLPTGTLTFLFTDIEGSTRLLQALGPNAWERTLRLHNRLMREAIGRAGGVEVGTEGDAFFVVFDTAPSALIAATEAQRALSAQEWTEGGPVRVRMGIHTGEGIVGGDDYVGIDVHRAARIAAAAHGGQVLLSETTRYLVESSLPDGVTLRDLGAHRLKDLNQPEHLYQLVAPGLSSDFPAVRSFEVPTNLPSEPTSFVGRERELRQVKDLLGQHRLVTLTGPGGSGKTRLALRAAAEVLDRFPNGVFFVELAPITDPHLVPRSIAAALGVRDEGPLPVVEVLQRELRDLETLLLLDNFEQVVDAAPIIGQLLAAAPRLRALATSRAALKIRGEQEVPVPPMAVPEPRPPRLEEISRIEAVVLFAQRASAVDPSFVLTEANVSAVAEICARLDGLPLAVELAASRISVLPPVSMLERLERRLPLLTTGLRDVPERQRTLRGAIAWSYDLLPEDARTLFRRLSAFVGGWTDDAAEAVSNPAGVLGIQTLEGIGVLVENSLAHRAAEAARFGMLQTIREFGLERLDAEDDAAAVRRRHARYFESLAASAEPHLRGPDQERWLAHLELEHDNLRAALRWAVESDDAEIGLRLVGSLWRFWHLHGHLSEGRRWASEVLALPTAAARNADRARALTAAGGLAYWQFDVAAVRVAYEEALSIFGELDDPDGVAEGTYNLAFAHGLEGDMEGGRGLVERSRSMFEELGQRRGVADALWTLSLMDRLSGDVRAARVGAEESLGIHRELGDRFGMTDALHMLGRAAFEMGDVETARASFLESLDLNEPTGNRSAIAIALDNMAAQEIDLGRPERALRLAGASDAVKESAGGAAPANLVGLPDPRDGARRSLTEKQVEAAWEEGRSMSLEQALALAREKP